jgi:hypothetical protein
MSDTLAARIRTAWPLLLGHVAAFLVAWVLRLTGVEIEVGLALEAVSFAASWAIWELGRRLEASTSQIAQTIGRWLLSAGKDIGAPIYGQPPQETASEYEYAEDGSIRVARSTTIWPTKGSSNE